MNATFFERQLESQTYPISTNQYDTEHNNKNEAPIWDTPIHT